MWTRLLITLPIIALLILLTFSKHPKWLKKTSFWESYIKGNLIMGLTGLFSLIILLGFVLIPDPIALAVGAISCGMLWIVGSIESRKLERSKLIRGLTVGGIVLFLSGVVGVHLIVSLDPTPDADKWNHNQQNTERNFSRWKP